MKKPESPTRHIYVPPQVWREWKRKAKKAGLSMSAFLRLTVERYTLTEEQA